MSSVHPHPNISRFSGFAATYDAARPAPPTVLLDVLTQLIDTPRPELVVDLGAGTGLSTRLWARRAARVIGIEPNPDMRRQAQSCTPAASAIVYHDGISTATGLPDDCADVVTACQALHWMEPDPTFAEIARILRPGGVFAAIDCDWPPTITWELDAAYRDFDANARRLEREHGCSPQVHQWAKHEHLARMLASNRFRYVNEVVLHQVEQGDADRLVSLALSQGGVAALLRHGLTEDQIGLPRLRQAAAQFLGRASRPWHFSYRVRLGVK